MKDVWRFIAIILISTGILALYSFSSKTIKIGGVELKKTGIKSFFVGDTIPQEAMIAVKVKEEVPKMDSSSQKILLIGDSMLEQLRWAARDYCEANGHELYTVMWYSSQSMWFGQYDTLKYYINLYKPTYVMLVLGANELFVSDIKTKRADFVKKIINDMGDVPFVWVGPPNWKDDTGINDLILRYAKTGRYYPSYKISLNNPSFGRYKDGAHPLPSAASYWMDELAVWIMNKSDFPIILNKPEAKGSMSTNTVILQPLK
ncbi:MAG: SGNH/GDSL hydrolase family protein [Bacteroidales bacterium]|nr:SGNH/GDSL hydrolase family protein [Bacteroidales bacterium]